MAALPPAIGLLILIGFTLSVGATVEQGQGLNFYKETYPETNLLFDFLTWKAITTYNLDRLYIGRSFVGAPLLFGSSLFYCTFTTQLPLVKKLLKFGSLSHRLPNIEPLN